MSGRLLPSLGTATILDVRHRPHQPATSAVPGQRPTWTNFADDSIAGYALAIAGCVAIGLVNNSVNATLLSGLLLAVGGLLAAFIGCGRSPEIRGYALTFGVCLCVAAGIQCYSEIVFREPMTTIDAWTFYHSIITHQELETLSSLEGRINAPLAIIIWQFWYALAIGLGCGEDPFIGIQLNAAVVGLSATLAVKCGRELFGADALRLKRIANLCAACGIYWLFGAVLLRDCFSLFFSNLILWTLLRWLTRPTNPIQFIMLSIVILASGVCSYHLRHESSSQLIAIVVLAGLTKLITKSSQSRLLVVVILIAGPFIVAIDNPITRHASETLLERHEQYSDLGFATSSHDSLGMAFVVNQPLYVRLVAGSLMVLVHPMPLWALISPGIIEYDIIKTYQGAYCVFLVPWIAAGFVRVCRILVRDFKSSASLLFLILYCLATLFGVAVTSIESRHHGQYFAGLILLAAVPNFVEPGSRIAVRLIAAIWWLFLIAIHLAWATLKFA